MYKLTLFGTRFGYKCVYIIQLNILNGKKVINGKYAIYQGINESGNWIRFPNRKLSVKIKKWKFCKYTYSIKKMCEINLWVSMEWLEINGLRLNGLLLPMYWIGLFWFDS